MGMNRLALIRAMAGIMGSVPLDNAIPVQKEMFEGRKQGRPKIHKDRPKPQRRDKQYLESRHTLLPKALASHKVKVSKENLDNRYHKSHRTPVQQAKYDQRIIDITARRFNLQQGDPFPVEAIVRMALKGVREAIRQYNRMAGAIEKEISPSVIA